METLCDGAPKLVLQYGISPTKMTTPTEKKYKTDKLKLIRSSICALLNGSGGRLDLIYEQNNIPIQHISGCVRMIEQCIVEMVGVFLLASYVKLELKPSKITINIRKAGKLITVNYNLYLPSQSQVIAVPPTESPEEIIKIVKKSNGDTRVEMESHQKRFVKGEFSGLAESTHTELKQLKETPSKCVTLADRITGKSNKITQYVSAFANHDGGHIYYGINDLGQVEGQVIRQKEKDEIVRMLTKTINKMVWNQERIKPERGREWEIFFEPVVDVDGKQVSNTFVIVVFVASHPSLVFTEEPESYHILQERVQMMSYPEWCANFYTVLPSGKQLLSLPSTFPRISWSSRKNREIFHLLNERLIQHRNEEDMNAFKNLIELAMKRFPNANVELIVMAENVAVAYKNYELRKAESLLTQLGRRLASSHDRPIFEVRMLHLKSMIERSKGNYQRSHETAQVGLQLMERIPVELHSVWFYIEAAMITTTMTTVREDLHSTAVQDFKDTAVKLIEVATKCANMIEDPSVKMNDLRQKLHIYKAWVLLGCSITGESAQPIKPTYEDIEAASQDLVSVTRSVLQGSVLTHFRRVQYHLAECDLFRRRAELLQVENIEIVKKSPDPARKYNFIDLNADSTQILKQAFECGAKARDLARKHHFENMADYANKRLADITESLVRLAVSARRRHDSNSLLGMDY